jgi:hypothetical protein
MIDTQGQFGFKEAAQFSSFDQSIRRRSKNAAFGAARRRQSNVNISQHLDSVLASYFIPSPFLFPA